MKEILRKVRLFNIFYVLIVAVVDKFHIQNILELKEEIADLFKAIPSLGGKIRISEESLTQFKDIMLLTDEMGGIDDLHELLTELKQAKMLKNARDVGDIFLENPDLEEILNKAQQDEFYESEAESVEKKTPLQNRPNRE